MIKWCDGSVEEFLRDNLAPRAFVFEWGCGASTRWFAEHCGFVVSVEHDKNWLVGADLRKAGLENFFIHLEPPAGPSPDRLSDACGFAGTFGTKQDFQRYVEVILQYPPCFDLVYIDGRARPACVRHAKDRVRRGGWVLLHDSEREHYKPAQMLMAAWKAIEGKDGEKEFIAWQRP